MLSQWFVVGAGRCGLQLARALATAGIEIAGVEVRSQRARARARRALPGVATRGPTRALPPATGVLIAVPDSAIAGCAADLAPRLHVDTQVVLHTSGLHPASVLAPLAGKRSIGSFHPLVSFPSSTGAAVHLEGAFAVVEGEPAAVRHARGLARTLGMRTVALAAGSKPHYHAAAALAANLTHVLVVTAAAQLDVLGFPPRLARRALAPLIASSMAAALAAEGMENLTGPLGRGDAGAVRAHLAALPPAVAAAYRAVAGLAIAARASEGLLNERRESEMHAALTG